MAGKGFSQSGDMSGMSGFFQDNYGEISKILGGVSTASMSFAAGGKAGAIPINAEGGEVVDTPFGLPMELMGPSHAKGGVNINVPQGTDIYSKRLKGPDGKSMADRKKAREKEIAKLEKLVQKNPSDKILKATLEKVKSNNDLVDQEDVSKMQFVQELTGQAQSFANGGTVGTDPTNPTGIPNFWDLINSLTPKYGNKGNSNMIDEVVIQAPKRGPMDTTLNGIMLPETSITDPGINSTVPIIGGIASKTSTPGTDTGLGLTLGDTVGMAGSLISTFGPMQNTIRNRRGDTPNINAYKNYGQDGLSKLNESKQYIDQVRDQKLQDLELSRQGTMNRNNGSARGINTLRALNLATDSMANNSRNDIYNQFAQAMQGVLTQEAGMLNDRDSKVMQGDYMRDIADRQDRDNFFSQMGKDISTMGTGVQNLGRNINQVKSREVSSNILNQMYNNFGINTMTGDVKTRATEEINSNPTFYQSANPKVLQGILYGQYVRKGDELFDKNGNKIDPATLNVIGNASTNQDNKYKLNVDANSIYDQYSPFKSGQA